MTGGCQCGRIRFRLDGEPRDVHYCHCSQCRRAVGNAFATLVWVAVDQLRWLGGAPARWRSSEIAERGFCARCGSPVYLRYDGSSEIALMVGLFDDPTGLVPTHHYGIESRLPWVDIGKDLPGERTAKESLIKQHCIRDTDIC